MHEAALNLVEVEVLDANMSRRGIERGKYELVLIVGDGPYSSFIIDGRN